MKMQDVDPLPLWKSLVCGATAPMCAVMASNPLDVARVRMQLQGELMKRSCSKRVYLNTFHCVYKMASLEGPYVLWRGAVLSLGRECALNVFRLGCFAPILAIIYKPPTYYEDNELEVLSTPIWAKMIAGATSGMMGGLVANPFDITKTRVMSQVGVGGVAVGHQHGYSSAFASFRALFREGPLAMFKGAHLSVTRVALGSSVQLTSYVTCKEIALERGWKDGSILHALSSMASGFVASVTIAPVDTVRTRIFNQPVATTGSFPTYNGFLDTATKMFRTEGIPGFFKGSMSNFLRLGPHLTITFVALEKLTAFARSTE